MKVFMAMPFAPEFDGLYETVKDVCNELGIDIRRADEIQQPGAIISQIFVAIAEADAVVAEVSNGNPNVYYEIGLAHCRQLATIFLVEEEMANRLPFDIRHMRAIRYNKDKLEDIKPDLKAHLFSIARLIDKGEKPDTIDAFVQDITRSRPVETEEFINQKKEEAIKALGLHPPLSEIRRSPSDAGWSIVVEDSWGRKVGLIIDVNGNWYHERLS